jgi:hypothetical protein
MAAGKERRACAEYDRPGEKVIAERRTPCYRTNQLGVIFWLRLEVR